MFSSNAKIGVADVPMEVTGSFQHPTGIFTAFSAPPHIPDLLYETSCLSTGAMLVFRANGSIADVACPSLLVKGFPAVALTRSQQKAHSSWTCSNDETILNWVFVQDFSKVCIAYNLRPMFITLWNGIPFLMYIGRSV